MPAPLSLPASLEPVLAFVNTVDVEEGTDVLRDGPAAFTRWLAEHDLAQSDVQLTDEDLQLARDLRAGLRALALANAGGTPDPADLIAGNAALEHLPLTVRLDDGRPELDACGSTLQRALGPIVAGYVTAAAREEWGRLRRCPADDCAWAFWDSSRNATRRWCSMGVCGNRAKARAYAARRRTTRTTERSSPT